MPKLKYIPGSVWGNKEIVSYHSHNKYNQPMYLWRCLNCKTVYGPSTGTDISRSTYARCCQYLFKKRSDYRGAGEMSGEKLAKIRAGAVSRKIHFDLTAIYLWELFLTQDRRCVYSGELLEIPMTASLDRIDSSLGYIEGNVQWTHKIVNIMKYTCTERDFISWCRKIAEYTAEKEKK